MNDEPDVLATNFAELTEELAILPVMQTPAFRQIKSEEARRRFFKLATAYWDMGRSRRRSRKPKLVAAS
jgi:hypothetical protein